MKLWANSTVFEITCVPVTSTVTSTKQVDFVVFFVVNWRTSEESIRIQAKNFKGKKVYATLLFTVYDIRYIKVINLIISIEQNYSRQRSDRNKTLNPLLTETFLMHLFANMTLTLTTWPTWPFDHLTYNLLLTSKNAHSIHFNDIVESMTSSVTPCYRIYFIDMTSYKIDSITSVFLSFRVGILKNYLTDSAIVMDFWLRLR